LCKGLQKGRRIGWKNLEARRLEFIATVDHGRDMSNRSFYSEAEHSGSKGRRESRPEVIEAGDEDSS
jgi:hypothetical protein